MMNIVLVSCGPISSYQFSLKSGYQLWRGNRANGYGVSFNSAFVISKIIPVLINVAQKIDTIIRLTCFETVAYPIEFINLMLIVLITILIMETKIVTVLVRPRPVAMSFQYLQQSSFSGSFIYAILTKLECFLQQHM